MSGILHALVTMSLPKPGTVFMANGVDGAAGSVRGAGGRGRHDHGRGTKPVARLGFQARTQDDMEVLNDEATVYRMQTRPGRRAAQTSSRAQARIRVWAMAVGGGRRRPASLG